MGKYNNQVDLTWGSSGDLVLDTNTNDLEDTHNRKGRNYLQRIETRLKAAPGDWKFMNGSAAANLRMALGKPNSPQTQELVRTWAVNALMFGGFLSADEFKLDVAPGGHHSVLIFLQVQPRGERQAIIQVYRYDFAERAVYRNF